MYFTELDCVLQCIWWVLCRTCLCLTVYLMSTLQNLFVSYSVSDEYFTELVCILVYLMSTLQNFFVSHSVSDEYFTELVCILQYIWWVLYRTCLYLTAYLMSSDHMMTRHLRITRPRYGSDARWTPATARQTAAGIRSHPLSGRPPAMMILVHR